MTNEAKALIGIGLATLAIIFGFIFLVGKSSGPSATPAPADPKYLIRDDSHQTKKDAKVTLVEFGDFQCPGCASAYPMVKQLKEDYKDKVNFVFRNFPLSIHANSRIAAEAAEAASLQNKFWEMHDKLYENQDKWSEEKDPMGKFTDYAKEIGLNVDKFKEDIKSSKVIDKVKADETDATILNVDSTPTFYLDNQKISGIPSLQAFKALIEAKLK